MALSVDNASAAIPGTVRDAVTGVLLAINEDGSISINLSGVKSTDTGTSIDNSKTAIPGTIRDGNSGAVLVVNADGSLNVATS